MKKIVLINSSGRVGKDTFVNFCKEFAKCDNYSSIDTIRNMLKMVGYRGNKGEWDRRFLSDIKKLCVTYNDFPHKETLNTIRIFYEGGNDFEILFLHVREIDEIERLKAEYPKSLTTLFIKNDNVDKILSNDSDAMVEYYHYDCYIENNGTLGDLKNAAETFVKELRDGKN